MPLPLTISFDANITTFNIGNVDSAAVLLYCAGKHRYSLPGPGTRFLIHGNQVNFGTGVSMDASALDAQAQQIKSLNRMVSQVLSLTSPTKKEAIEQAIRSQIILTPEEAMEWGIVQEIRKDFMEPGATLIAVNEEQSKIPETFKYSSVTPQ